MQFLCSAFINIVIRLKKMLVPGDGLILSRSRCLSTHLHQPDLMFNYLQAGSLSNGLYGHIWI